MMFTFLIFNSKRESVHHMWTHYMCSEELKDNVYIIIHKSNHHRTPKTMLDIEISYYYIIITNRIHI